MKTPFRSLPSSLFVAVGLAQALTAAAVTFTNDATIGPGNTNYDFQDITVTNCTVTIDGPHTFANLHVLRGGLVSHSFSTNGLIGGANIHVAGELQTLSRTNPRPLAQPNVFTNTIVVTDFSNTVVYVQGTDYTLSVTNGITWLALLPGSALSEGALGSVSYDAAGYVATGLNLSVSNNVEIEVGGALNVTGKGYGAGVGPGAGASRSTNSPFFYYAGSGGGHGGYGGASSTAAPGGNAYDSLLSPSDKGSGGGAGGNGGLVGGSGGGAVNLTVGNLLRVDGQIAADGANGANPYSGGGAGGSLWLSAQTFSGAGTLSANGAAGEPLDGGGGGGGRIALYFATNLFTGSLSASGGAGATSGGAGTLYTAISASPSPFSSLVVDNSGRRGTNTPVSLTPAVSNLTISGGAVVQAPAGLPGVGTLFIRSNSWLVLVPQQALRPTVSGDATIEAGGGILGDALGNAGGQGSGAGRSGSGPAPVSTTGGGGGYGGYGGMSISNALGGAAYGSTVSPTDLGSGGGPGSSGLGGPGGGALVLSVSGTLLLNGSISANGGKGPSPGSGGGSGGSVWLTAGRLFGTGIIAANGGSGELPYGGGGAGGRVALVCSTNSFTGLVSARGGAGAYYGGAGTIYSITNYPLTGGGGVGLITVDNGGFSATNSSITFSSTIDLTVSGGAVLDPPTTGSFRNLVVGSNSFLALGITADFRSMTVTSNATIQRGGGILLDGRGSAAGVGTGAGRTLSGTPGPGESGGGAGYGGNGGSSAFGAAGGVAYGSLTQPTLSGSGGGIGYGTSPNSLSGRGGGALELTVAGTLQLDGRLSAAGMAGLSEAAGGGSGGSLFLIVGKLAGSGLIDASGGSGDLPYGGGGGGGRIAISYKTNLFAGTVSALGGAGANYGGAGTIYWLNNQKATQVIVDNGGRTGASTPWTDSGGYDLTIAGGATVMASQLNSVSLNSLLINSNGWLTYSNSSKSLNFTLTVTSNATIQAGGGITLDGQGFSGGSGPGLGGSLSYPYGITGGGGGYGGYGGASAYGAAGGNASGSLTSPTAAGSGGGNGYGVSPYNLGGAGGGALHLSVARALVLNGRISADGNPGVGESSGGGSGGSLWLGAGQFSGTGTISASGGSGDLPYGGGGGGGRIALYYTSNLFAGTIVARGGPGATYGGAGTVYLLQSNVQSGAQIIVDNGGSIGTNTLLGSSPPPSTADLTIGGGAVVFGGTPSGSSLLLRNLLINSNGWLTMPAFSRPVSLQLTLSGNATIQAGGAITLDAEGYATGGLGAGGFNSTSSYGYTGGGGGYGGFGGMSIANATGGNSYGSMISPVDPGSGGGGYSPATYGAPGGGALHLLMTSQTSNTLTLNGRISADGAGAAISGSGGGAGGSLWLSVGKLVGSGVISANGGVGDFPQGGGGGGGRIALYYSTSNLFAGTISAHGGLGAVCGGAGTVFSQTSTGGAVQIIVDNGGLAGTNTLLPSLPLGTLTVSGGAVAYPSTASLVLNNLLVDSGATLTHLNTQTNLDVLVFSNALVGPTASIAADGKGYNGPNGGPGAGQMSFIGSGSGAGYGGVGGASLSGMPGGTNYGSASQPTDRGSRGGIYPLLANYCEGGGALRLRIGGRLTLNGRLSANGNGAQVESAGGGAGGSIWVTARDLEGSGQVTANGGAGDPIEGGGGGGGRIALLCRTNNFLGSIAAVGGDGANPGGAGTVILTNIPAPQVIAQTPSGMVASTVSSLDLTFNSPLNYATVTGSDFSLNTPSGPLAPGNISSFPNGVDTAHLNFPTQSALGFYEIDAGPQIQDIYGQSMSAMYIGGFVIVPPTISGRVLDTNGVGVPYATIQVQGEPVPIFTDTTGAYSVEVLPGWTGSITPSRNNWIFIPSSRTYTNVSSDLPNQNFVMAASSMLGLAGQKQGANLNLAWFGINGVSYQPLYSTNLVDWIPYGSPLAGTNGPLSLPVTIDSSPAIFFRYTTSY